jgi:hypothetical protein
VRAHECMYVFVCVLFTKLRKVCAHECMYVFICVSFSFSYKNVPPKLGIFLKIYCALTFLKPCVDWHSFYPFLKHLRPLCLVEL